MSATEKDDAMDLDARLARLSPAQRALLERRLLARRAAVAAASRFRGARLTGRARSRTRRSCSGS